MQTATHSVGTPAMSCVDHPDPSAAPRPGDEVIIERDALLELQVASRRAPRTWRFVERGTRARLIACHDGVDRIVLHDGPNARQVAFVAATAITRAPDGSRLI